MQCIFLFFRLGSGTGGSFLFCSPLGALLLGLVAQQFIYSLLRGGAGAQGYGLGAINAVEVRPAGHQ